MSLQTDTHYYRHVDGGLYRLLHRARHADDTSEVIVYEHLWPFEPGVWVRNAEEFRMRFFPIGAEECRQIMTRERAEYQAQVLAAKAQRRNAK